MRHVLWIASLVAACCAPRLAPCQSGLRFALQIEAPPSISGAAGGLVDIPAIAKLTSDNPGAPSGVEGWSIGIAVQGGVVASATTDGTAGAPATAGGYVQADGFEVTTVLPGGAGVTSAIALTTGHIAGKVTLPPVGTESLLRLTVRAPVPLPVVSGGQYFCAPKFATVKFQNDIVPPGAQPVANKVVVLGEAYRPTLAQATVQICPVLPSPPEFRLSLSAPSLVRGTANRDAEFEAIAQLTTTNNTSTIGVQGWSIAISSERCSIVGATSAGTAAAKVPDGGLRLHDGFELTELTTGTGNEGVISAVVLSSGNSQQFLPLNGTSNLLRIFVRARVPNPVVSGGKYSCEPLRCQLFYKNGLRGSGEPVQNKATFAGLAYRPALFGANVDVCPTIVVPAFTLSVAAPAELRGPTGGRVQFDATAQVTTANNPGADGIQGWSIALSGNDCRIIDATVAGTQGVPSPRDGFEKTELTTGIGNEGVISAVVLSASDSSLTLPPTGTSDILKLRVEATVPDPVVSGGALVCAPRACRVFYKNGLKGSGEPVGNKVTHRGLAFRPQLFASVTNVCSDAVLAVPKFPLSVDAPSAAEGRAGTAVQVNAVAKLTTRDNPADVGIQGWSIALSAGDCKIVDATVAGTAGAKVSQGGLRLDDGFELTELASGPGNEGVISAVVLSFGGSGGKPVTLPPLGPANILRLKIEGTAPDPVIRGGLPVCEPLHCDITYRDGLRGTGQPVDNKVSFLGFAIRPSASGASVSICPTILEGGRQKPADENQDGKLDISDPIAILNFLFLGTNPSLPCGDGSVADRANKALLDSNGDDTIDISDPVYVLSFLFLGGPRPLNCVDDTCPCIRIAGCPDVAGCN